MSPKLVKRIKRYKPPLINKPWASNKYIRNTVDNIITTVWRKMVSRLISVSTSYTQMSPEKSVCESRSNSYNWIWNNGLVPNWGRSMSRLYNVTLLI